MTTGYIENPNPVSNFDDIEWGTVDLSTSFESEKTKRLYDWWTSFKPSLPTRSSFDILDHIQDAANIFLYESVTENNFVYRVNGEDVKRIVGLNLVHGQNVFDGGDQNQYALIKYLANVRDTRLCHKCTGTLAVSKNRHARFESIDCPLLGEDSKVQFIVGVIEQLED